MNLAGLSNNVVKFNELNYADWSEQIQFQLGVLDLDMAIMMDEMPAATETSTNDEKSIYEVWHRSNKLSLNLMCMSMAENVKPSMPRTENAKEFMKMIKEYSQSDIIDKSIVGTLMSELTTKKFDWSQPIHEHVTGMANIAARLKSMGMEVNESFLVQFIMNSLPPEFGQFQVNYNTIKDKWNFQEIKAMLVQEEGRLKKMRDYSIHLTTHEGTSFNKAKPGKNNKKDKASMKVDKGNIQKDQKCFFCKKVGHFKKDCPKRKSWFERKGTFYVSVSFEANIIEVPENTWWLDSGATTHVSNIMQGFLSIQPIKGTEKYLYMGNRMKARIEGIGTYRLIINTGYCLNLEKCLYVPSCARNLIFVAKLDCLGFNFRIENDIFHLYKLSYYYGSGTLVDGLYRLNLDVNFSESLFNVKHVVDRNSSAGKECSAFYGIKDWVTYPKKGLNALEVFINKVERQLDRKVKVVRSDRGGEYYGKTDESGQCPGPFAKYLESRGICAQYTMPGTPQQNGVAERRNRTFMDMVRRFLAKQFLKLLMNYGPEGNPGCPTEVRLYNPHEKKLDARTISGYFIDYPEKSKGYRFYCPNHSTRIVESGNARFIENGQFSGSEESQIVDIQEHTNSVSTSNISYEVVIPLVVSQSHNKQRQQVNVPIPQNEHINVEPVNNEQNWLNAMKEELKSMDDNKVWDLVELPDGSKRVGCKWVFKTKHDSKGNIERYKARLVAKGFTQKDGIDYKETFSPISKKDSLRIVLALVTHYDLELHQMDVKTAFLNGDLEEEVYMDQPEGFTISGKENLGDKFSQMQCPKNDLERKAMESIPYASVVGSLMYAQTCTQPDISFVVGMLGRYQSNPGMDHWKVAKKVLRYLQGTKEYMLIYRKSDHLEVIGYSDSDYAGCVDSRKSTFGSNFLESAKQSIIVTSTMEVEFVACFEATVHALWLRNFVSRLDIINSIARPIRIYCDNSTVVFFSKNDKYSKGAKHMDLKYLLVKEEVHKHRVLIEHIGTNLMIADPLTKGLPPKTFIGHVESMSIMDKSMLT
ncbi:hypothetical protein V8G54_010419 [Vigna mungo]|uniref:Retrovirus-related Pol polyprotein from transposon TNT 1-94 n=1 Tax=Vigna mungo TaxID=3915 RepID=A0AAQ3NZ19_VIGMU